MAMQHDLRDLSSLTESESCSVVSDSLHTYTWIYSPWNSPGQNTGVGSLFLLQGILEGSNPSLPHCRRILYQLSHKGSHRKLLKEAGWSVWYDFEHEKLIVTDD